MKQYELIHASDWNVLIILDSCRYDYFEEMNTIPGKLSKVNSSASCTIDWLVHHFHDKYPYVYVSANPNCINRTVVNKVGTTFNGGEVFEKVINVILFGYSRKYYTVLPRVVTAASILYLNEEKVIIHYLQPHFPFIGKTSFDRGIVGWGGKKHMNKLAYDFYMSVDIDIIKQAYRENMEIILTEMDKLLSMIPKDQRVVITADHGELLQEKERFHPCNHLVPELVNVPWLEVKR